MNRIAMHVVTGFAEKMGYSIIPKWRLENRELAQHLGRIFERYSVSTVFDVGANAGQYHDFLRQQVGFTGRVYSFEPQPHLVNALQQRQISDPAWEILNFALGSHNSELALNVMARDTFSSFRQPLVGASEGFAASNTVVGTVTVPVRRLDDLFANHVMADQSCYLKVDTQGFDLEVLRGAPELLKTIKALQFELPIQQLYAEVPPYREILETVEAMGFRISGFFPISMDEDMKAVEFDCVMVRAGDSH
ncbi:MAG: FkbM family methyltransferase [Dechloromonas sp.]|nr:MAG: FkbM family methyltransferase [Dechloromonas sp.]